MGAMPTDPNQANGLIRHQSIFDWSNYVSQMAVAAWIGSANDSTG